MAIQQHPIPQEVAGYKFRLIGDMTVKQFIWLAAGILGGILFYSLPLPFFFKYPLAAVSVAIGAGTAFLPIQGRPMDKWIIAFIRSIYSPTQYVWQKTEVATTVSSKVAAPPVQATPVAPPAPTPVSTPAIATSQTATPVIPQSSVASGAGGKPQAQPLPQIAPVKIPVQTQPVAVAKPAIVQPSFQKPVTQAPTPPKPVAVAQSAAAPTESKLPIPFTPSTPNTLVGMTLTPEGKILPGSLIEIKSKGNTIRATKSNQLGQFLFAKPLENGLYQIATEKEGYKFDVYSIDLTGQIVKPLKLQAK